MTLTDKEREFIKLVEKNYQDVLYEITLNTIAREIGKEKVIEIIDGIKRRDKTSIDKMKKLHEKYYPNTTANFITGFKAGIDYIRDQKEEIFKELKPKN